MAYSYLLFMIAGMVLAIPMWRIVKKWGERIPYWRYCIPIYNLVLLCRFARIPAYLLFAAMAVSVMVPFVGLPVREITWLVSFLFFGYLSSGLAYFLGKNRRLWFFLGGVFFFIPLFVFGFDSSYPGFTRGERSSDEI